MEFKKKELFVVGISTGKRKKDDTPYVAVKIVKLIDPDDAASEYTMFTDDIEILTKVKPMEKWKVNLKFKGGKSGIRLEITDWIEKIGQV